MSVSSRTRGWDEAGRDVIAGELKPIAQDHKKPKICA